jgi:hypothetical protein
MKREVNQLEEYVREALAAIRAGVSADGSRVEGTIDFDVAVTNTREGEAGFKIYVVTANSKLKGERVTHLSFKVRPSFNVKKLVDGVTKKLK